MINKILVTGIGGNVGYGILKNIRNTYSNIEIIGTNTERISAGNHLCDEVYEVPFSTNNNYIPIIQRICNTHNVKLIIPSTDYEVYILSLNRHCLPIVAASSPETCKMFLDKYFSYKALRNSGLNFAKSILPSNYDNNFEEYIVKPREGRGSRNIFVNPTNPKNFSDEYIIQPLLKGKEITTAFYVNKKNELHGLITMERKLAAGTTNMCEVNLKYDRELADYILMLIKHFDIKGACNLQSIITDEGIVPFEVNCRISGTNSIRSQFGFKDVCYTVDEYLFEKELEKPHIKSGSAIRILYDIIYPETSLEKINNKKDTFYIYE